MGTLNNELLELVPRSDHRRLGDCEVTVWLAGGYVHTTGKCPEIEHGTVRTLAVPMWAAHEPCPVCGQFAHAYDVSGPAALAATIRLALALKEAGTWIGQAERNDIVALANAGVAIAVAAEANDDLIRTGQRSAALTTILDAHRRSLRLLRARRRRELNTEVIRRWLVGADGSEGEQPDSATQRHVWRAAKWAVRTGADVEVACVTHQWMASWVDGLNERARELSAAPTHFLIAEQSGSTKGERVCLLAAAGLLDGGPHVPGATWVPESFARGIAPGQPGVTVVDAGRDDICDESLLPIFFGLWEPGGTGPLAVPAGALAAAVHISQ